MTTLTYKGKEVPVGTGSQIYEAMQLIASDLSSALNNIRNLATDVRATIERDNNRDAWLKRFFDWSVPLLQRNGQSPPIGLLGLFNPNAQTAQTAQTPAQPAEPTTPTKSPHRQTPRPTITAVHPGTEVDIEGVDRAHLVTLLITSDYLGSTALAEVTFGTQYEDQPVVVAVQIGNQPAVNVRVGTQTNNSYQIWADAITDDQYVEISVIVCPRSETEAFD